MDFVLEILEVQMLSTTFPSFISMSNHSSASELVKLISEVAVPEGRNKPQCLLVQQKVAHLNDALRGREKMGNTQPYNQPEVIRLALSVTYYWLLACAVSETEIKIPDATRELVAKIDDLPVKVTNFLDSKIERNALSLECDDLVESAVFRTSERTVTDNRSDFLDEDVVSPLVDNQVSQSSPTKTTQSAGSAVPTETASEAISEDPILATTESEVADFIKELDISTADHRELAATAIVGKYGLGVVSTLLQLLRVGGKETSVQAAGVLRGLAGTNQSSRKRLVEVRGVPVLVQLLTTDNPELLGHAITVLANTAIDDENAKGIAIAGALPLLVDAFNTGRDDEVKCMACVALRRLARRRDVALAIHDAGAVAALVKLLRAGVRSVKVKAAGALAALAYDTSTAKKIALAGAIPLLVQLVPDCSNSEKDNVLVALQNLAVDDENNDGILAVDALPLLLQLLKEGDDFTQPTAASTLRNLAKTKAIAVLIAEAGPHCTLVSMLANGSADAKKYALKLICSLLSVPAFDTDIVAAGAVPHLIATLSSNHEPTVTATATTIAKLSKSAPVIAALLEAGALTQLEIILREGATENVRKEALVALKAIWFRKSAPALVHLVGLLSSAHERAVITAATTIAEMAHAANEELIEAGALTHLGLLLNEDRAEVVQEKAVGALHCICKHTSNVQAVLDAKVLPLLVLRMSKGSDDAKRQNLEALSALVRKDQRYKRAIQRAGAYRRARKLKKNYSFLSTLHYKHKDFAELIKYNSFGW